MSGSRLGARPYGARLTNPEEEAFSSADLVRGDINTWRALARTVGGTSGFDQHRLHPAGAYTGDPNTLAGNFAAGAGTSNDHLYCIPDLVPEARVLRTLTIMSASTIGEFKVGVYRNRTDGTLYPGERIYDSGALNPALAGGRAITELTIDTEIPDGSLIWCVLTTVTGCLRNFHALSSKDLGGLLGYRRDLVHLFTTSGATWGQGVGWRIPHAYVSGAALPATAPTGVSEAPLVNQVGGTGFAVPAFWLDWEPVAA